MAASLLVTGAVGAATLAAAPPGHASATKASGTTISLRHSPKGKVLDESGRTFTFVHVDSRGKNVGCNAVCQSVWAMVTTAGKPQADNGVKAKHLGQTTAHQVTYFGHPLFSYTPSPKSAAIDGAKSFQGHWRLINAKGHFR